MSTLRTTQCAFSLSTLNVLVLSFNNQLESSRAASSSQLDAHLGGRTASLRLLATCAALFVSMLCALHCTAGIVRRLADPNSKGRRPRASSQDSITTAGGGSSSGRSADLKRADSVYGGSSSQRLMWDFGLLTLIFLAALGLALTKPAGGSPSPLVMVVGLGALFAYKPVRALREVSDLFLTQMTVIRQLVAGLRQSDKAASQKGGSEVDDVFDERDLSRTASPEVLAAEVIRLRRKIAELEDKVADAEDEAAATGRRPGQSSGAEGAVPTPQPMGASGAGSLASK